MSSGTYNVKSNFFKKAGPPNFLLEELHNNEFVGESPPIEDYDHQYPYSEPLLTNDTYQQLVPEPYLEYPPSETDGTSKFSRGCRRKPYQIDLNNINLNNSLPYVELRNIPVKLLIDTGCHG
ncbi:hypothetical protein Trydic_g11174 [Trypoxylus dichotomus]